MGIKTDISSFLYRNAYTAVKSGKRGKEKNMAEEFKSINTQEDFDARIKERLERALNDIREAGVFNWSYCGPKGKEIPQTEIEAADFDEWTKLYITFQLIPEEPDQGDRLENKRKRIEAALEKKAIEDDRATVEAEKIRKKRRQKTAQKSKKGSAKAPKG